jgi:MoxR-like ATPase
MRLSSQYQPTTLGEVVGQPAAIRRLREFAAKPYPRCLLFEGRGGIGKSATAKALIRDLGVCPFSGLVEYSAANLTIDEARWLFGHPVEGRSYSHNFRMRPMSGSPWHVLLIEEMELLPSKNVIPVLKDELSEQNLPPRLIVVATSNDVSGLDEALLQRFDVFPFSAGPTFAADCEDRLRWIWEQEVGDGTPMPAEVATMGWRNEAYSMRRALAALGAAVEMFKAVQTREEVAA